MAYVLNRSCRDLDVTHCMLVWFRVWNLEIEFWQLFGALCYTSTSMLAHACFFEKMLLYGEILNRQATN
jgi:hypothetical protein